MDTDLKYRLIFGNIIDLDGDQPQELMLEQGSQKKISDGKKNYLLLLCGIKVNRKIYQPTEIEAELDIIELIEGASNQQETTAPQFDDVSQLLLQRMVTLDVVVDGIADDVATNCYVYELIPQLQHDIHGTKMYVKLRIFSVDKLMTLNKYSKAYVARKLGSEILKPESMNFGTFSEKEPLIASDVTPIWYSIMSRSTTSWCAPPTVVESSSSLRTANWCWACRKGNQKAIRKKNRL